MKQVVETQSAKNKDRGIAGSGCFICGEKLLFTFSWSDFDLYKCTGCGNESVDPIPSAKELEEFYQKEFYKHSGRALPASDRWQKRLGLVERAFAGYLDLWSSVGALGKKPSRFLDIGGGLGYYAKAALNQGIDACLMDYSDDAMAFGRETLGVKWTVQGDIQACAKYFEKGTFDFVLARHTIEHMRDPMEYVTNMAGVLRSGGLLEVETPNVVSHEQFCHPMLVYYNYRTIRTSNPAMTASRALRQAVNKSMSGVNPPKHLWGFTPRSLRALLENCGFEVLQINQAICGHPIFDPLYYDLYRLSTRKNLGIPYYFWERIASVFAAGHGMNLAVLARKR